MNELQFPPSRTTTNLKIKRVSPVKAPVAKEMAE